MTSGGDGFGQDGSDRTVIRPNPGGRRPQPVGGAGQPAAPQPAQPSQPGGAPPATGPAVPPPVGPGPATPPVAPVQPGYPPGPTGPAPGAPPPSLGGTPLSIADLAPAGNNPLINAAIAPLTLIPQFATTAQHSDVEGLRQQLIQHINAFEVQARNSGESPETINAARYCLCTALDEAVLSTPWGSASTWSTQSLLVTFHKEAWGGEKFFLVIENLAQDPGRNINLLEFLYVLLCLGFQGKFRVLERGDARLEELRSNLFERLRPFRGEFERELSPRWRGDPGQRRGLARRVPLWVVAALTAAVVLTTFAGFSYVLTLSADPVQERLESIGVPPRAG